MFVRNCFKNQTENNLFAITPQNLLSFQLMAEATPKTVGYPNIEKLIDSEDFESVNKEFEKAYKELEKIAAEKKGIKAQKEAKKGMVALEKVMELLKELLQIKYRLQEEADKQLKKG